MATCSDVTMESEEEEEESSYYEDDDEDDDPLPGNFTHVPAQLIRNCSPHAHNTRLESSGARLSFFVNGRYVPQLPEGGSTELKLQFKPGGTSSGFVTVTVCRATVPSPSPCSSDPSPIITDVVSGQAAQKVLNEHQMKADTQNPLLHSSTPVSPCRPPVATKKYIPKGPPRPFKCTVCSSPYKLISELRAFACLCSPVVIESVNKLKLIRKKKNVRKRLKNKVKKASKESATSASTPEAKSSVRPGAADAASISERATGPARSPTSPQLIQPDHGKMVIMVDDFYYGCDPGGAGVTGHVKNNQGSTGAYHCVHCPETLINNIALMSHMKTHAAKMAEGDHRMHAVFPCPHCFRHFGSLDRLQFHAEAMHALPESTCRYRPGTQTQGRRVTNAEICSLAAKCKICELDFGTEPVFLQHMKFLHRAGEMPYVCQVCNFRSSFYRDVWSHFEESHGNTKNLLCPYCLKVLRSGSCFMQHFAKHQRKSVFSCKKCRLHFLCVKERQQHCKLHHGTHIMPQNVTGLKPGTRVSVRTYSSVAGAKREDVPYQPAVTCKVVDVEEAPSPPIVPRMKPMESLAHLVSNLSSGEEEDENASRPSHRCVECLKAIPKLSAHFPSRVRCSLCPFATCCSVAYANHMIKEHTLIDKTFDYPSMFQFQTRLPEKLSCASCSYSTDVGDNMATHMAEQRGHMCITSDPAETRSSDTEPTCNSISPSDKTFGSPARPRETTSSAVEGGAFVPIRLVAPPRTPNHLSVKVLPSPCDLSSPAAMTVKFVTPRPPTHKEPAPIPPPPPTPALRQKDDLLAEWECRVATWVLIRHEQQFRVTKEILLRTGSYVVPESRYNTECYRRAVENVCRRMQPQSCSKDGRLPPEVMDMVMEKSIAVILSLCSQIQSASLRPRCVGFMDELSIFVDPDLFSRQKVSAFQLLGSLTQKPHFDVVLSALSDGTFLPPVLFFRGSPVRLPAGFPDNVLLEARHNGFTDAQRLTAWTQKVWRPQVVPNGKSLLMVDVHRGHTMDEFKFHLSAASTDAVFIPAGCSCRLQPLDVCIKPVLHRFLQVRWDHLAHHGGLDGLNLDQLALMLACWLSEVSSTLTSNVHIVKRSFAAVCHLQKEQKDANHIIQTLINKLSTPLTVPQLHLCLDPKPGPHPNPPDPPPPREIQLLLVLHKDHQEKIGLTAEDGEKQMTS
ncbi:pogo transposable element with ZNF domain isoform X2 [Syngnathoides biaculeatus]|uniref:pogo transposable element with ZNF domain isoform X2 n=1 Tax=Syngnathoides biaculeatus TaxID=300417 RepID=UPI002ADD80AC|nr:pogo transposable element with ZNF domain isoform X2 [Syngnathoides biaculeatus]